MFSKLSAISESLKKYNRPDLEDARTEPGLKQNIEAIKKCFVDPIGSNKILDSVSKLNHLFLIGRRGTGKSTLFLRSRIKIHEERPDQITSYIDINSVFEKTKRNVPSSKIEIKESLSIDENLIFLVKFLGNIYKEIFLPISKQYEGELIHPLISKVSHDSLGNISSTLSSLIEDSFSFDVNTLTSKIPKTDDIEMRLSWVGSNLDLITSLKNIEDLLLKENFKTVHIFIDDYNELPIFIQHFIHFNVMETLYKRDSNAFLFKVAKYPGMIEYGTIDMQKIDSIYLDFHGLFSIYHKDFSERSKYAKTNIKELLNLRATYYGATNFEDFVDGYEDFIDLLFDITLGNPRYIGWLLDYSIKLISEKEKISVSVLEKASLNYYDIKIQPLFEKTAQMQRPFNLKTEVYNIIDLLRSITNQSREIRSEIPKRYSKYKDLKKPPTSHFHVSTFFEDTFELLELNLFLNKVREAKTKDGSNVIIYSLNHGLCRQQQINFGRPEGTDFRDYQIETIFNFNGIVTEHLKKNIIYLCTHCNAHYSEEQYKAFAAFEYDCPKCRNGANSIQKIAKSPLDEIAKHKFSTLEQFDEPTLDLLYNLKDDSDSKPVSIIAAETDYSIPLLAWRNKRLMEQGYTDKETKANRIYYKLKEKGEDLRKNPHNYMKEYLQKSDAEVLEDVKELVMYDIAFSFAGEDRETVESIAKKCIEKGLNVFYDKFEKSTLWGKDLYQYLHEIYSKRASFCIIVVSENYKKLWTNHELKSAQEKEFLENGDYILPLKVDGAELPPGIRSTKGYVSLKETSIDEVVELIIQKVKKK